MDIPNECADPDNFNGANEPIMQMVISVPTLDTKTSKMIRKLAEISAAAPA